MNYLAVLESEILVLVSEQSSKGKCRSKEVRFLSLCWSRTAKAEPKNIVLKKISNRLCFESDKKDK
jgi:hypothetical protein